MHIWQTGEIIQWVKHLLCNHEDISSSHWHLLKYQKKTAAACNLTIWEAEDTESTEQTGCPDY